MRVPSAQASFAICAGYVAEAQGYTNLFLLGTGLSAVFVAIAVAFDDRRKRD